jgi:hypothetical protein
MLKSFASFFNLIVTIGVYGSIALNDFLFLINKLFREKKWKKILILLLFTTILLGQRGGSRQMRPLAFYRVLFWIPLAMNPSNMPRSLSAECADEIITGGVAMWAVDLKSKRIPLGSLPGGSGVYGYEKAVMNRINLFPGDRGGGIDRIWVRSLYQFQWCSCRSGIYWRSAAVYQTLDKKIFFR